MLKRSGRQLAIEWVLWMVVLAIVTAALFMLRDALDKAHIALVYVLVVLGASSRGGRRVGMSTALIAFLLFNFFFVPPHFTLGVAHATDWLVLVVFLATSATAAHLLSRYQSEAATARSAAALREADRMKNALLASVSHDLRTPLTTIKALAQDIRVDGDERAAIIEEEADRLNRFVSDLLDLSW